MRPGNDRLFGVKDLSIVVAGGAGGLGAAMARELCERGARIIIADLNGARAQDVARELQSAGGQAISCTLDVVNSNSCDDVVGAAVTHWGRIDGLVNASGVYHIAPALDFADLNWQRVIDINLTGAFRLARAAGRLMVPQGHGSIVTLTSVSSTVANPSYAAYAASKAGAAHVTRVLALEWATSGVRVNAIGPAVIPTALSSPLFEDDRVRDQALAKIPMGRFGSPDDLLAAAIFLLAPGSAFMTGQVLYVDGGRTIA